MVILKFWLNIKNKQEEIEEYIDLEPVLDSLFMDKKVFLKPIKEVKIQYA